MDERDRLIETYRNLTETLVGALAAQAPKGQRIAFLLEEAALKGFHEGTDEAVADFCSEDGPGARLMRLVSAAHRKALLEGVGLGAR